MTTGTLLGLMALFVVLQSFFSGSEIALVTADRLRLRAEAEQGRRGSALAVSMLERPTRALGTCLIGTNLCAVAAATLGARLVADALGWSGAWAALLVVPITLTLGEMVPKAVYQHHADRLVGVLVFPLQLAAALFRPALWALEGFTRRVGGEAEPAPTITRQEIRLLLEGERATPLTEEDRAIIRRLFEFTQAVVEEAMIPLIEVVAVPQTATCAEAARRMIDSGHSRIPVFRDRIDQITGIVLHQDLLSAPDWSMPVSTVLRPALFVPESKRVDALLLQMRRERERMAVVVDEYGGAVGLITIEDLLEEIVGDIEDESDRSCALVRRTGEREWMALGRAEREHVADACGLQLPEGDFETIAGCILQALGRVPTVGEKITVGDYELTVTKANDRAILEVRIRKRPGVP